MNFPQKLEIIPSSKNPRVVKVRIQLFNEVKARIEEDKNGFDTKLKRYIAIVEKGVGKLLAIHFYRT